MKLFLATVGHRGRGGACDSLAASYTGRLEAYVNVETVPFRDEAALLEFTGRLSGRTSPCLVLLDSRGRELSSEELAKWLADRRDSGTQALIFAIGPADGWSEVALGRAHRRLSLSRMTLPHDLSRVVLAEQLYRVFTILAGHPYHLKH